MFSVNGGGLAHVMPRAEGPEGFGLTIGGSFPTIQLHYSECGEIVQLEWYCTSQVFSNMTVVESVEV
jgi:hypothetical protein